MSGVELDDIEFEYDVVLASSGKKVFDGSRFGACALIKMKQHENDILLTNFTSDEIGSHSRGVLLALKIFLGWVGKDGISNINIKSSNEYISKHYPKQIESWINDKKRPNYDLITETYQNYEKIKDRITFSKIGINDQRYMNALALAQKAVGNIVTNQIVGPVEGEIYVWEVFDEEPMLRAMNKDPWG